MRNLDKGTLSDEQARHYRTQGYYRLANVFSRDETAELRAFVAAEAEKESDRPAPPTGRTAKMYRLYDRNPDLMHRVISHPNLVGPLKSIRGPNIVFLKNRHNHAAMNSEQGAPAEGMHRDILQPTRSLLTAAIYLQDASAENGATRIIPGSHELPFVGVPEDTGGGVWMDHHEEYAGMQDQALPVPMSEGGVLLFSSLTFHGVGGNRSGGTRTSLTLAFRAVDELDAHPDDTRQIVVTGEQTYRGNDARLWQQVSPGE